MNSYSSRMFGRIVSLLTASATALAIGGSAIPAVGVAPADFGLKEGDVISAHNLTGDPDVYIVNEFGFKRLFVNPQIFNLYGHLGFDKVRSVPAATRDAFGTSGLFRNCESGDQRVFGLDVVSEDFARLRHINISGPQAAAEDPNFFKKVFCINNNEQNLYGTGSAWTALSQVPDYSRGQTGPVGPSGPVTGFNANGDTQGSIDSFDVGSPDDNEIMEGQNNVEVYVVDIDLADDGPLLLQSADVRFAENGTGASTRPWDYFDEVCLVLNGDTLNCQAAGSSSNWTQESSDYLDGNPEYRKRWTGLSGVLDSGETNFLSLEVSAKSVIDSADFNALWNVELGQVRVLDESGLSTVENTNFSEDLQDSFTVTGAEMASVQVTTAANEIASSVIQVSKTVDTNNKGVFRFSIEELNGIGVDIDDLQVTFMTVGGGIESDVIRRARIKEGSTKRGSDKTVPNGGVTLFQNLNVHLNGDQKKDFTVEVDLKDTNNGARYPEGTTIMVTVNEANIAVDDANGFDESEIPVDADVDSDEHELRTVGIKTSLTSTSQSPTPGEAGLSSDKGTFTIKYSVTAFGATIWVDDSCGQALGQDDNGEGTSFVFNGTASLVNCTLASTGTTKTNNNFRVLDGESRNFTLTVVAEGEDAFVSMMLEAINWGLSSATNAANEFHTFGLDDYETDSLFLDDQGV